MRGAIKKRKGVSRVSPFAVLLGEHTGGKGGERNRCAGGVRGRPRPEGIEGGVAWCVCVSATMGVVGAYAISRREGCCCRC